MVSKYDEFWVGLTPQINDAIAAAAQERSSTIDVQSISGLGARSSWSGSCVVEGDRVVRSQMAHATSLGRAVAASGACARWSSLRFVFSISASRVLSVRAEARHPSPIGSPRTVKPPASALGSDPSATEACARLHRVLDDLPVYTSPADVPFKNGLYFFYEHSERGVHGTDGRIVRIGNHPHSQGRLVARLGEHYKSRDGAKNGSVFRRYLGGALLRRANPSSLCLGSEPGAGHWERGDQHACNDCRHVESSVSEYIETEMFFRCIQVDDLDLRNHLEQRLIASVAQCEACNASNEWLGRCCYRSEVPATGLWNAQHVQGSTASTLDLEQVQALAVQSRPAPIDELSRTLLVFPCSARKQLHAAGPFDTTAVRDRLSDEMGEVLLEGRRLAFERSGTVLHTDTPLRPALEWYSGQPYATPGFNESLLAAMRAGLQCVILSGGYGLLTPGERIHSYEAHMGQHTASVWRPRLGALLRDYIERNNVERVFIAVSRPYANCLPPALGVSEWRCVPTFNRATDRGSAMRVVPQRIGSALVELLHHNFVPTDEWTAVAARTVRL